MFSLIVHSVYSFLVQINVWEVFQLVYWLCFTISHCHHYLFSLANIFKVVFGTWNIVKWTVFFLNYFNYLRNCWNFFLSKYLSNLWLIEIFFSVHLRKSYILIRGVSGFSFNFLLPVIQCISARTNSWPASWMRISIAKPLKLIKPYLSIGAFTSWQTSTQHWTSTQHRTYRQPKTSTQHWTSTQHRINILYAAIDAEMPQ